MRSVHLYSLETGHSQRVTDGMSDSFSPVFDRSGKYLYLLSSTDAGPTMDSSMDSFNRPVTSNIYVAVLRKDVPSPLAPERDRKSTRLNSSHSQISYAVFCLKKINMMLLLIVTSNR